MSEKRKYWQAIFTVPTWEDFLQAGGQIYGINDRFRKSAEKTKPGDYLICYVAVISRIAAILEIKSEPYRDIDTIWEFDIYPIRLRVEPVILLDLEAAVPIAEIKADLSFFKKLKTPSNWSMYFRSSLKEWSKEDAEVAIKALEAAKENPTVRPISKSKRKKEPQ